MVVDSACDISGTPRAAVEFVQSMEISMRALLLVALCIPGTLCADESFRCGRWVVSAGSSPAELVEKCGPPTSKQAKTEDIRAVGNNGIKVGTTTTETWTWVRPNAQPMIATLVDGKLRSLDRGR
jgi:hypothetical protein